MCLKERGKRNAKDVGIQTHTDEERTGGAGFNIPKRSSPRAQAKSNCEETELTLIEEAQAFSSEL